MQIDLKSCSLGMELGSTRIKAVLIDASHTPLAQGDFTWENRLQNGIWTYPMEEVRQGVQAAYAALAADVQAKHGTALPTVGCIGVSAMMHGYLAFDENWNLLVPFRTWRNTMTAAAAAELTAAFGFNIPQRWSVAHLYQAMLNREPHLKKIAHITTLAGYLHFLLTGVNALGVGDASGMFPIDSATGQYDAAMLEKFNELAAKQGYALDLRTLLPAVLCAGADAGALTKSGAAVAMVHCNNCTSDLNAWVNLLAESAALCGATPDKSALYETLFRLSLLGAPDCGGIASVNYISGEGVTHFDAGIPLLLRRPDSNFSLANFMRAQIYAAFATLALGLDILKQENVALDILLGHGGIFKTPGVAQRYLAAAAGVPVTCLETAGEGGPYGMALLAAYRLHRRDGETLADYLQTRVFAHAAGETVTPSPADTDGFAAFLAQYKTALQAERALM